LDDTEHPDIRDAFANVFTLAEDPLMRKGSLYVLNNIPFYNRFHFFING